MYNKNPIFKVSSLLSQQPIAKKYYFQIPKQIQRNLIFQKNKKIKIPQKRNNNFYFENKILKNILRKNLNTRVKQNSSDKTMLALKVLINQLNKYKLKIVYMTNTKNCKIQIVHMEIILAICLIGQKI